MMRCCLNGRLWVVLVVLAAIGAATAGRGQGADNPNGRIVGEVVIVGNRIRKTEAILTVMKTRPGTVYDPSTAQEDIRLLQGTKWFVPNQLELSTSIAKDGRVTVFVRVVELMNTVEEIVFIGAQHLSKNELNTAVGIRKGEPMNVLANRIGRDNILRKYQEEGRTMTTVELVEGNLPTDTRVVYNIVEGPVVKVKAIEFRGAVRASVGRLKAQVVTHEEFAGFGGKFDPVTIDLDRQKLSDYYKGLGFLCVQITPEVVHTADIGHVVLVYHIIEGQQYFVAGKQIDGNRSFDTATLEGLTELQPGEPYDRRKAEADVKRMKDYMGERGYNVAVEQQAYEVVGQPGLVQVHYQVQNDAAAPKRVGRVKIVGNEITQDRVILNQLGLYPGQVFEYPQLAEAKARLQRLGLFDNETSPPVVEVDRIPTEFDSEFEDILVSVRETRTGTFMVGGSVNSDMGLMGNISINERNFDILRFPTSWDDIIEGRAWRGAGEEFRIEAMPGIDFSSYRVTWRNPTIMDTPFGLTVAGYFREMEYAEYLEERIGLRVTIDRQLDPYWRASLATRVEEIDCKDAPYWAPEAITVDMGHQFLVGVRAGLTRDDRNSYLNPTKGSVFDIGVEQCFGFQQFPIGTASYTQFVPMKAREDGSGQQVLILKSSLAVEGGNAPVYERFYGGGIGSMRGFDWRGVGPYENDLAVGGTFMWLNTIEYQVPILANDSLKGVIFCDHGTVEQNPSIHNYRVAIGAGIRVAIPALGPLPLALDFGIPLNQAPSDHKQLVSFSMGVFGGPGGY